jgi:Tfp pilus assembly protein PilN
MDQNQNKPDYSFLQGNNQSAGRSKKQRIMIAVGGGVALLIVIFMAVSLLFGGGENTAERSLKIAQLHTELIRVSELGQKSARSQTAKNLATNTNVTLLSDEAAVLAIANEDQKVSSKLLKAGQDSDTDKALTEAEQRNQFDEIFVPLLVAELKEYQSELKEAFENSNSKKNKQVYSDLYDDLTKIIETTEL